MEFVEKKCCLCGKMLLVKVADWNGDVARILSTSICCDDDCDEGEDDDSAWRSEQPLRVAEGWGE